MPPPPRPRPSAQLQLNDATPSYCRDHRAGPRCIMSTPSSSTPQPTSSQQPQSAAATQQFVAYPLAPGQQPQLPPQVSGSSEVRTQPQTRLPSAETRQDRSLVDFLLMLDDYEPLVCVPWALFTWSALSTTVFPRKRFPTKLRIITSNALALTARMPACEFLPPTTSLPLTVLNDTLWSRCQPSESVS